MKQRHPLSGEANPRSTLTEKDARKVLALKGTMSQFDIAQKIGVSVQVVQRIHQRQTWKSLPLTDARCFVSPGENNGRATLAEKDARKALSLKGKLPQKKIAEKIGVSLQVVQRIHQGQTWKRLHK